MYSILEIYYSGMRNMYRQANVILPFQHSVISWAILSINCHEITRKLSPEGSFSLEISHKCNLRKVSILRMHSMSMIYFYGSLASVISLAMVLVAHD